MDELELQQVYRIEGDSVVKYTIIGETDINYIAVPSGFEIMAKKNQFFSDRFDALYSKLIINLSKGIRLSNYKSSKYYKRYVERLKEDHPEWLI
jgi:uncharacterized short protein YbdD (DUF466 family)